MTDLAAVAPVIIASAIGSVGLWKIVEKLLDRWWKREDSFEKKHGQCMQELEELKARVAVIEFHHSSYLARWIKDATKRISWVNDKAFLSIFAPLGLTREEVLGKTFADFLDPLAADEIDRLDQAALAHPEVAASNVVQLHPSLPVMVIVKVAAVGREGELVFEGYAYRTNDRMIADGIGVGRQIAAVAASAEHVIDQE